jgi:hypothetical protein
MNSHSLFRKWTLLLSAVGLIALGGCIEITEEYYFRTDGSGKFRMTVDFSAFGVADEQNAPMNGRGPGGENYKKKYREMSEKLNEQRLKLQQIEGIDGIVQKVLPNYVTELQFEFAGIRALNRAMLVVHEAPDAIPSEEVIDKFEFDGTRLRREFNAFPPGALSGFGRGGERVPGRTGTSRATETDSMAMPSPFGPDSDAGRKIEQMLNSMFTYTMDYSFERPIAGTSMDSVRLDLDRRGLRQAIHLKEMADSTDPNVFSGEVRLE